MLPLPQDRRLVDAFTAGTVEVQVRLHACGLPHDYGGGLLPLLDLERVCGCQEDRMEFPGRLLSPLSLMTLKSKLGPL